MASILDGLVVVCVEGCMLSIELHWLNAIIQ